MIKVEALSADRQESVSQGYEVVNSDRTSLYLLLSDCFVAIAPLNDGRRQKRSTVPLWNNQHRMEHLGTVLLRFGIPSVLSLLFFIF